MSDVESLSLSITHFTLVSSLPVSLPVLQALFSRHLSLSHPPCISLFTPLQTSNRSLSRRINPSRETVTISSYSRMLLSCSVSSKAKRGRREVPGSLQDRFVFASFDSI